MQLLSQLRKAFGFYIPQALLAPTPSGDNTLLDIHYNTVGRWVSTYENEGPGALRSAKRGRKKGGSRNLTPAQEKEIQKVITPTKPLTSLRDGDKAPFLFQAESGDPAKKLRVIGDTKRVPHRPDVVEVKMRLISCIACHKNSSRPGFQCALRPIRVH